MTPASDRAGASAASRPVRLERAGLTGGSSIEPRTIVARFPPRPSIGTCG